MKKFWHIALLFLCGLMISSCGDDDDKDKIEVDEVWKAQNEEAFQAKLQDPSYEKLYSQSNAGFILYKVLEEGKGKEQIYYTSRLSLYYKGTFINGDVFDDHTFEAGEPYRGKYGTGAMTSEFVDGFATALQYMHEGDTWEIIVPNPLGYGSTGKKGIVDIKPYTTLNFVVTIDEIMEQ